MRVGVYASLFDAAEKNEKPGNGWVSTVIMNIRKFAHKVAGNREKLRLGKRLGVLFEIIENCLPSSLLHLNRILIFGFKGL